MKTPPNSESDKLLESFMKEHFPFTEFKYFGFFTKEMKGDYEAQAEKVCKYFGYKSVYEYGAKGIRCHLTYASGIDPAGLDSSRPMHVNEDGKLKTENFITEIGSIYE